MLWVRVLVTTLVVGSAAADAQPKGNPPLIGATEVARYTPAGGFIDDAIGADGPRLAYVVADSASKAELHVVGDKEQVIDITAVTLHPVAVTLVGPRALIVGQGETGMQNAALIELSDKPKQPKYKIAPAAHVTVITRDGKRVIAVDHATATKSSTTHEVELVSLETGRRIAGGRAVAVDAGGAVAALDFRINDWSDGMTRAHGIKGGEWNKQDDQRSPDVEATYDLVNGKFVETTKITDLFAQRKRFQVLADAGGGALDFVRVGDKGVELWRAGKPKPLELDQPLASYEPKSLQAIVLPDGSGWLALQIDPVNAEAVARKKADPEYLDVFRFDSDGGKAIRKARVLATGTHYRFGIAGDRFWLLEKNAGLERGGKNLAVYAFATP